MLRYALMCITAFMFICGRNNIHTINIQPIPPFSGNFLREVSDFDNIVEPETNQEPVANVIKTRGSMNEEDSLNEDNTEKCPHCGESDRVNPVRKNIDINNIKRELGEMGTLFVNKLLESDEESAERLVREDEENKDDDKEKDQNEKYKDAEFIEEQDKAENLTKQSKLLFDQIENPPLKTEAEQVLCCNEEEDSNKEKSRGFVNSGFNKRPNSDLLMHFYKYQPESRTKAASDSKKSVLINLYPKHKKGRSPQSSNKYDYIALLSNNNRLVQVPAVKFTVVPEESEGIKGRLRRSENFEPFYVYKYRKHPHRFRFEPVDNMFHVVDTNKVNYRRLPHIPILFVNTIPQIRKRFTNKLRKRSSNFDLSDNKYLREADLLIQNLNTSLQMGLGLSNKPRPVDAGVLVSSNYDASSMNRNIKGDNKKTFKKEVVEDFASALQDEAMSFGSGVERGSLKSDSEAALVKEDNLVKSDAGSLEYAPSPMENQADSFVNNDVGSMEGDSNKDSLAKNEMSPIELGPSKVDNYVYNIMSPLNLLPQKKDKLVKSEVSPIEIGPNKIDSFVKSVMSPLEGFPSRENGLVKSEVSPMEMGSSKVDNLVKSEISPMETGSSKLDNLVKSEISPIEVGSSDNLVKNEISPMEVGSSKADNLVKNEISPMEVGSSKADNLVANEISPIEVGSSKADNLVKSEISPIEVESSKADNLVKSEISPMEVGSSKTDNLIKSEISPIETESSNDNSFVKNVINPLGIGANKQDHLTKNEISPINVASKYNGVVKSEISPVGVVPNKESNLIKSEINPMVASPSKKENFVKNDVASGLYKSNVVNNDLNKPVQLITNKGLSNGMVKSQIDPVLQNVPNDNTFSENQVDSKVGDLSENMVDTKVEQGASAKLVDTKDTISNAYLVDLLRNVDLLKKSDPNMKFLNQNNDECVNHGESIQQTKMTTTECPPDVTFTIAPMRGASEPSQPGAQANIEFTPIPTTSVPVNVQANTLPGFEDAVSECTTYAPGFDPNGPSKSLASSGLNQTKITELNKSVVSGVNISMNNVAITNESSVYEDESDIGSILDLLATNLTTSAAGKSGIGGSAGSTGSTGTTGSVSNIGGAGSTVKSNGSTSSLSALSSHSDTSIPTISVSCSNSSPVVATVVYEKSTSCSLENDAESTTAAGLLAKGKTALLTKLHNLQKDLKLVFEVQNILTGAKKEQTKNKRSKRETLRYNNRRSRRKCNKHKHKQEQSKAASVKLDQFKKVQALGKILQWKAKLDPSTTETELCKKTKRFLFKKLRKKLKRRRKKKKKKKKKKWWKRIFGKPNHQHFLGEHIQNLY